MTRSPLFLTLSFALGLTGTVQAQQYVCPSPTVILAQEVPQDPSMPVPPVDADGNQVQVIESPPDVASNPDMYQDSQAYADTVGVPPGTTIEVTSGMPTPVDYGPPPAFENLDTNGDGVITEREASAYPLLANDFLYAARQGRTINPSQYARWAAHP